MAALTTDPRPPAELNPVAPRRLLLVAALGTVYVAWGSTYLAVRVMVDEMPALTRLGHPRPRRRCAPGCRSYGRRVVWSRCA